MKQTKRNISQKIVTVLASRKFFFGIVGFFVFESVWIALTGRFPMAFDEDFHLGIIKLYANHLSPFWSGQPDGANMYGAIARDPSYLYHYLLSFQYRFVALFTDSQTIQAILLRAVNIGLFASSLPLYRRLLLKSDASKALVHACLSVFILVPIVPLLAAQINYDNMMLPLTALALLLTTSIVEQLKQAKRLDVARVIWLAIVCMFASLVKYAFLPIAVVIVGFILLQLGLAFGRRQSALLTACKQDFARISLWTKIALATALLISTGLFGERYFVNIVQYHGPVADCAKVIGVDACSEYGPWVRDYKLSRSNAGVADSPSAVSYVDDWLYGMWLRSFFAVDGPTTQFQTRGPLTLPALSTIAFAVIAAVSTVLYWRKLVQYRKDVLWLFAATALFYVLILFFDGYKSFVQTGHPVAINGRYLLPILPLLLCLAGLSLRQALQQMPKLRVAAYLIVLICFLWGGGALTYILRSSDTWYWPGSQPVLNVNHAVKTVVGPVVPGYDKPVQFLH